MSEQWRLFIAIELPGDVQRALARLQADFVRRVPEHLLKPVRPEGIHLTLKFLGDVPVKQLGAIGDALDQAASRHKPFDLTVAGIGCFPNTRRPNAIWAGVEGDVRSLKSLHLQVEKFVAPLGYPSEERGFTPHLTLARTRRQYGGEELQAVGQAVLDMEVGEIARWQVTEVSLMRSELRPSGAVYTLLREARLGGQDDSRTDKA
ncbi:MAG: RNA 2',3'-cyclic phosphodiesterase [Anaerolineae bacterium]